MYSSSCNNKLTARKQPPVDKKTQETKHHLNMRTLDLLLFFALISFAESATFVVPGVGGSGAVEAQEEERQGRRGRERQEFQEEEDDDDGTDFW